MAGDVEDGAAPEMKTSVLDEHEGVEGATELGETRGERSRGLTLKGGKADGRRALGAQDATYRGVAEAALAIVEEQRALGAIHTISKYLVFRIVTLSATRSGGAE
jgi:hypothetical protein